MKEAKTPTPNEILQQAVDQGLTDFYVAYSGGKDSGIALDFMAKEFPQYFKGVVFVNTGIAIPETVNFVESYCKERNYTLHHLHAEDIKRKQPSKYGKVGDSFSYENLVLNYGFPQQALHTITMRWLKIFSIRKFISDRIDDGESPAIISGIRKKESQRRKTKATKYIHQDGKMWFVSPLYFKSNDWVYKYFIENDIKRSPVYDVLHLSGDCLCGSFSRKEELKLLEMFYPKVFAEINRLEKLVQVKGSTEAKNHSKWGKFSQTTMSNQTQLQDYVCNDCMVDNQKEIESDTKRFDDEMTDIEKKLEGI